MRQNLQLVARVSDGRCIVNDSDVQPSSLSCCDASPVSAASATAERKVGRRRDGVRTTWASEDRPDTTLTLTLTSFLSGFPTLPAHLAYNRMHSRSVNRHSDRFGHPPCRCHQANELLWSRHLALRYGMACVRVCVCIFLAVCPSAISVLRRLLLS